MIRYPLSGGCALLIEQDGSRKRLVITNGADELACRKETKAKLLQFLSSAQTQLFKGRLQFHKKEECIQVCLKGELLGMITYTELENGLL